MVVEFAHTFLNEPFGQTRPWYGECLKVSISASILIGVALFVIGASGWIWATIQGGFDTPVLHHQPPLPFLTLMFFFMMILGPSLFCAYYPFVRKWLIHKQWFIRILFTATFAAIVVVDILVLHAYTSWVYRAA